MKYERNNANGHFEKFAFRIIIIFPVTLALAYYLRTMLCDVIDTRMTTRRHATKDATRIA
jgi:hypothetical protein